MGKIAAVCISEQKGTVKKPVPEIQLEQDYGIVGDAHAGKHHRQVSLLAEESTEATKKLLPNITPGVFAENILTSGITLYTLPVGTVLKIGQVRLQVTQIGKECHAGCEIRRLTGDCVMPREGIFTIVLEGGTIRPGDEISLEEPEAL